MRVLPLGFALWFFCVAGDALGQARVGVRLAAEARARLAQEVEIPAPRYDYTSYEWLELDAAEARRLKASGVPLEIEPHALEVRVPRFAFDPLADGPPRLAAGLRADGDAAGFRLVQFGAPVRGEWLEDLGRSGAHVLQYYPHYTYLVWVDGGQEALLASRPAVRWVGAFHPAYKVNTDLDGRDGLIRNVEVLFYNRGGIETTLQALRALGARVLDSHRAQPDGALWSAIAELPAEAVAGVARIPEVLWLGYESPRPTLDDEMSAQILAGNTAMGVPFTGYNAWLASIGRNGAGVVWAIVDTGVDYNHPDLSGHIAGGYSFPGACNTNPGEDCANGGHGTHVAGIVGGNAAGGFADMAGFLYGLGIAPSYSIFAMNSLSSATWPPAGGWQEHSKRAILGSAIGGNNSWTTGEGTAHGYQASERTHDMIVLDGNFDTTAVAEPFIEVFSAGNSGPGASTLTAPKEAKNLIVVASSRNFRAGDISTISNFSSRGPTVDGRYGITVTAPGEQIASTRNDVGGVCATAIPGTSNLYALCSGTSMAAPHASGAVVLAAEWWQGGGAGRALSPAMARALLVNTAEDLGTADIPNASEGWGRVNLKSLFDTTVARIYRDSTIVFADTGEFFEATWNVPNVGSPLKVTIAWSDAPGAVGANPALVNNLNLTVTTNAMTYLGNNFASGWSATGGAADALHTEENVFVASPGSTVTVRIDAANIAGDAILYNGDPTDQAVALVCSNCAVPTPTPTPTATPTPTPTPTATPTPTPTATPTPTPTATPTPTPTATPTPTPTPRLPPRPIDLTAGEDLKTRFLWAHPNGAATLKRMNEGGVIEATWTFGPYAGWAPVAVSIGTEGHERLLWSDGRGRAVLTRLDGSGNIVDGDLYGPYPGWKAADIATGPYGWTRLLWRGDTGGAVVWFLDGGGALAGWLDYAGIPAPWTGRRLSVGGDGSTRLLWVNSATQQAALWNVSLAGAVSPVSLVGPFAGYSALDVGASRTLAGSNTWLQWSGTDGSMAHWLLDPLFGLLGARLHGPFEEFSPVAHAADGQGRGLALWQGPNGIAILWRVLPDMTIHSIAVATP